VLGGRDYAFSPFLQQWQLQLMAIVEIQIELIIRAHTTVHLAKWQMSQTRQCGISPNFRIEVFENELDKMSYAERCVTCKTARRLTAVDR
jgi:hypothetical protein